jgi:hypothetical protein
MEAAGSSEEPVSSYKLTRRYNPECSNLNNHRFKDVKF